MNTKREQLRAGIALLNAAAMMLEQAGVEFGGAADNSVNTLMGTAIESARHAAVRAVRQYDRLKDAA